jgi:hypothetical protein
LKTVALDGNGSAAFTTSTLALNGHSITAVYGATANFNASTSAASVVTVSPDGTTTTVTSSVASPVYGQSVTFTAKVAAAAPGTGTPTGSVTFSDGSTVLATKTLGGGLASFTTSTLAVGSHALTVSYAGSTNFGASSATSTVTVGQDSTTAAVTSSVANPVYGQSVTLTATVAAAHSGLKPSGTVSFYSGATLLGTGTLSNGKAALSTKLLPVGADSITVVYGGDPNFLSSTSPALALTVGQAGTTTALTSSSSTAKFGTPVTFTATVKPVAPGSGTPTGTVTFYDGSTALGTVSLTNGVAKLILSNLSRGVHHITAVYSADVDFLASTSSVLTQTIT